MLDTILLFGLLLLGSSLLLLLLYISKHMSKAHERRAITFLPQELLPKELIEASKQPKVCILAFSTATCRQCRLLQTPVLQRIKETHEDEIGIIQILASSSPELVERFQVKAFPTTALFDSEGKLYAINYGFANAQCLLKQVEEMLQALQASKP